MEAIFDEIIGQLRQEVDGDTSRVDTVHPQPQEAQPIEEKTPETLPSLTVPGINEPLEPSPESRRSRNFPHGLKISLPFKHQSGSFDTGSKPDVRENGQEIRHRRRKLSVPEAGVHRVFSRTSSGGSASEFGPTLSCASAEELYLSHSRSAVLKSHNGTGSLLSDPISNSLRLMVTLSSNKECLSTLVSYICLPKCMSRLVVIPPPHSSREGGKGEGGREGGRGGGGREGRGREGGREGWRGVSRDSLPHSSSELPERHSPYSLNRHQVYVFIRISLGMRLLFSRVVW